jgi:hypothetical protein
MNLKELTDYQLYELIQNKKLDSTIAKLVNEEFRARQLSLQMLKTFIKGRKAKTTRISVKQYNQELREAEAEYERGEYTTHEEFAKQIKKW